MDASSRQAVRDLGIGSFGLVRQVRKKDTGEASSSLPALSRPADSSGAWPQAGPRVADDIDLDRRRLTRE